MRISWVTLMAMTLLTGCPPRTVEDVVPAYAKAYDTVFEHLGDIALSDAQTRIGRLGDAGKPFQPKLAELRTRQGEVSDLMVKAVRQKQQALADKQPAPIEQATLMLKDADAKAQQLKADLARFNETLTAAGAPIIPPAPPRDPNARD